jgi:hypothetical protein
MKALFLGHFTATVAPRILAKVKTPLETSILDDEGDAAQLAPLLANAQMVVGHIWRGVPARAAPSPAAVSGGRARPSRHRRSAERRRHLEQGRIR